MAIFSRNHKIVFALFFTLLLFMSTVTPSFAESSENVTSELVVTEIDSTTPKFETKAIKKWGPYWVRPRNVGDYDGASVYTNPGVTTFQITDLQMIGVHNNESAYFTMSITDFNTGEVKYSRTFTEECS